MKSIVEFINGILWHDLFITFIIVSGIVFTVALGFPQIRDFPKMIGELRESMRKNSADTGVSPVQAWLMSMSTRLGMGNIAGVATAIATGGPGAVVWMWIAAFFSMATAFVEGAMAQVYKERHGDELRGGPAFYLSKGTRFRFLGPLYAVCIGIAYPGIVTGAQSNALAQTVNVAWGIPAWLTGIVLGILIIYVSVGGVKRFARFSQAAVPFAAALYILLAVVLLVANVRAVPGMFELMFTSALGTDALFGGLLGTAISWGIKRGVYSNEAGQGTSAHAAAAANTSHPARQGLIQSFGVFFDTIIICTVTALMMLCTNSYNVYDPAGGFLVEHLPGVEAGAAFPQLAINTIFPGVGASLMAVIVFFFVFTTLTYAVFSGTINWKRLIGDRTWVEWAVLALVVGTSFYGSIVTSELAWAIGDVGVGLMTWANMMGLIFLTRQARKVMQDYRRQKRLGREPTFDPISLGIRNATFWEDERSETRSAVH